MTGCMLLLGRRFRVSGEWVSGEWVKCSFKPDPAFCILSHYPLLTTHYYFKIKEVCTGSDVRDVL